MADYCARLANYLGGAEDVTDLGSEGWVRNLIRLKLAEFEVSLEQDREIIHDANQFVGRFSPSTTITVHKVAARRVEHVRRMVNDLAWLMSFASLSPVRQFAWEYPKGSRLWGRKSTWGVAHRRWSPLDIRDGACVRSFLSQVWQPFRQERRRRRLPVVFSYLVESAHPNMPLELRVLCLLTALEHLKDSFARQRGIPFKHGRYRKPSGKAYSFAELIQMMNHEVQMRRGIRRLIKVRNALVHAGPARVSVPRMRRAHRTAQDLSCEYVLRLLNYHGPYVRFTTQRPASM